MAKLSSVKRDLRKELSGAKNHAQYELVCSACNAPLLTIIVTHLNPDIEMNYAARCPHCGDRSFNQKIQGQVVVGHTDYTKWVECRPETSSDGEEVTMFITKVEQPYA